MGLETGQLTGPLPPWKVDLPDTFDVIEFDWANRLLKADDVEKLPIAGAKIIFDSNSYESEEVLRSYKWGKKGTLLRAIPKLIFVGRVNTEEFQTIKEAVEEDSLPLNVVILPGSITRGGGLIFGAVTEDVPGTFETDFTSALKAPDDDPDGQFEDFTSTLNYRIAHETYDHTKWIGYEVLSIETPLSSFTVYNSSLYTQGWAQNLRSMPRRAEDGVSDPAEHGQECRYVTYDYNPTFMQREDSNDYDVDEIEYQVYPLDEQKDADISMMSETYHPDIYKRIVVKCIHDVISSDTSFEAVVDVLEGNEDEQTVFDANNKWPEGYDALQEEMLSAEESATREVYDTVGADYVRFDYESFEDYGEFHQERVDQIITWIREFLGIE